MVKVTPLSPQNEMRAVERLAADIRRSWPDVETSREDRIDLIVGVRSGTDIDLLIAVDLAQPRCFRDTGDCWIQYALIAVEIKQLDPTRLQRLGNQVFAIYGGKLEKRSVADQARDASIGARTFGAQSGYRSLYVYAIAWLTDVDAHDLSGVDPIVIGRQAGWFGLLAACARQSLLLPDDDAGVRARCEGVRAVRDRLLARRKLTVLDQTKALRIAQDVAAREIIVAIAPRAGNAFIRLAGRGGSGKTTAIVLLAKRLATIEAARVLILTFHHALRGDIERVLVTMPDAEALIGNRIRVQTATGFLIGLLTAILGSVPVDAEGKVEYSRLDAAFRAAAEELNADGSGELATIVRSAEGSEFDWDHILIDEAQDWSDAERDLLRAVYSHRRIAVADGMEQLVRRQTPCDWLKGVPRAEVVQRVLGDSLRMQRSIAIFVNAFARAAGFADWGVNPRDDMPGGRITIAVGADPQGLDLVHAIERVARSGNADPVDCLVCIPPSNVVRDPDGVRRRAAFAGVVAAAGALSWDAVDLATRTVPPPSPAYWRIVPYDSCRGLEGWVTVLLDFDELYAHRFRHPNYHRDDRPGDDDAVARRWLLIPLTRAVHMLVITIRDPESPVAAMLREAADALPAGVVEWCSASQCASRISPPS